MTPKLLMTKSYKTWNKSFIGDPLRISQILLNLIGNAVKFTDNGSVTLKIQTLKSVDSNPYLQFEVIDTGIGVKKTGSTRCSKITRKRKTTPLENTVAPDSGSQYPNNLRPWWTAKFGLKAFMAKERPFLSIFYCEKTLSSQTEDTVCPRKI